MLNTLKMTGLKWHVHTLIVHTHMILLVHTHTHDSTCTHTHMILLVHFVTLHSHRFPERLLWNGWMSVIYLS